MSKSLPLPCAGRRKEETQGNRSCMLRVGERLMRAGSEGNLLRPPGATQNLGRAREGREPAATDRRLQPLPLEAKPWELTGKNSTKDRRDWLPSSAAMLQKKQHSSTSRIPSNSSCTPPRSPITLPCRRDRGNDSELGSLAMQHSAMKNKEVLPDHFRQSYAHHAALPFGHQDWQRPQVKSLHSAASPPLGVRGSLGQVEQQDAQSGALLDSLDTMSERGMVPATAPFTRGCRTRASLPMVRSICQTQEKSQGVLYLQYKEDTRQVRMPSEITGLDTVMALFVSAFPHQLTMKMMDSPNAAIIIKDKGRNVYYDLEDVRNIPPHSFLKVYLKDKAYAFSRHPGAANITDGRISKGVLYGSHNPVHTLPSSSRSLQGSMSPPMVRSMPSSPSRVVYSGSEQGAIGVFAASGPTLPQEHLSGASWSGTLWSNSSAILERRDVKPDEDLSSKSMVLHSDGGQQHSDSCSSSLQDREGHLSLSSLASSSRDSAPSCLVADVVDVGALRHIEGLQQYRASVRPLGVYGESLDYQTQSLHRQKSKHYWESQIPLLGNKNPPPPQRASDTVWTIDRQSLGSTGLMTTEQMSPIHRSLWRDSNGAMVEVVSRSRGSGSSSSSSSVFVDTPHTVPDRPFQGHSSTNDVQSERIKAMEAQIANLAGLVQHALAVGPNMTRIKDAASETDGRDRVNKGLGMSPAPTSQKVPPLIDGYSPAPLAIQATPPISGLQQSLNLAKRNVSELRLQLNQLRQLQVVNQQSVNSMLRMVGQELSVLMCKWLARSEQDLHMHRDKMEEELIQYLEMQDSILAQLSELELYVEHLKRDSTSGTAQVTFRDVEKGAVNLRWVGEALANLKSDFSELQSKMRSTLRAEMGAVCFLKEEPLKMDTMLKRVRGLTEVFGGLRRCVTENHLHSPPEASPTPRVPSAETTDRSVTDPRGSPKPHLWSSFGPPLFNPSPSATHSEVELPGPASPMMTHCARGSQAAAVCSAAHQPSPPLPPTHGQDSPTMAKGSLRSREHSPALQQRAVPLQTPSGQTPSVVSSAESLAFSLMSAEESQTSSTAINPPEIDTEVVDREGCHGDHEHGKGASQPQVDPSATTTSAQPPAADAKTIMDMASHTDFDQILHHTQACLMNSIPDLEVSAQMEDGNLSPATELMELTVTQSLGETLPDQTAREHPVTIEKPTPSPQAPLEVAGLMEEEESDTLPDEVDNLNPRCSGPTAGAGVPGETANSQPRPDHPFTRRPVEKPCRPTVEKVGRQSPDRGGKSPPSPPPRRFCPVGPSLRTGRSGEVIFTTRKESVGAQDGDLNEEAAVLQWKAAMQPPEFESEPQVPNPERKNVSADVAEDEDEEENNFLKELQSSADGSFFTSDQLSRSQHSSRKGSPEKSSKGQKSLQDSQRQLRQRLQPPHLSPGRTSPDSGPSGVMRRGALHSPSQLHATTAPTPSTSISYSSSSSSCCSSSSTTTSPSSSSLSPTSSSSSSSSSTPPSPSSTSALLLLCSASGRQGVGGVRTSPALAPSFLGGAAPSRRLAEAKVPTAPLAAASNNTM